MLLLPAASVNLPEATSIVVAPAAAGVNVAVYTVDDTSVKLLREPLVTVMSASAKFEVASLDVNVRAKVASLDVSPSVTSAAVIVIVGAVLSTTVVKLRAVVDAIPS